MNKKSLAVLTILSITSLAQAAQTNSSKLELDSTHTPTRVRSLEVAASLVTGNLKQKGEDTEKIDGNGLNLRAGKIFSLNNNVSTTSSVVGQFISLDDDDLDSGRVYDIGLSQSLSYSIETSRGIVKPFVELGYSLGQLTTENSYNDEYGSGKSELEFGYGKRTAAIGAQFVLKNNLVPFIKYEVSKLKLNKKVKVKGNDNGESFNETVTLDERIKLDSKTISIGIGYMF